MDQSSHPSTRGPQQPPPMNHDGSFHNNALVPDIIESATLSNYEPPSCVPPPKAKIHWVYNPSDGSVLCDHKGQPISVDKMLATKPLRNELSTRPGPGNKKLTYISGEGVSRTLNDIFGFDGWNLDTTKVQREECLKDATTGKYNVVYTAMVRLTHKASGAYKEDCGAGDSSDKNFGTAVSHALKASITDAMKRAARHFGDKLGNSLYQGNFSFNKAPTSLKDALDKHDIERAHTKFGFAKDQVVKPPATATSVQPTGFSRGPQTVVGATPRPNGSGPQGRPTSSYPLPQPIHPVTTNSHQQAVQAARPPTDNSTASHARTMPHSTSHNLPHTNTNGNHIIASVRNPPDGSSRSSSDYTNQGMQHRGQTYPAAPSHPPKMPQNDTLKSVSGHSNTYGQPQLQHKTCSQPPPNYQNATANSAHIVIPTTSSSSAMPPPPTSTDALRNSSLFGPIPDLPRPTSSKGRSNNHSNDSRRISIGDGLPTQSAPLVTPGSIKRPPFASVHNIDPIRSKRPNVNPYLAR